MTIILFCISIVCLLGLDLYIHRKPETITLKSAGAWSVFYIMCALAFAGNIFYHDGAESSALFLTGWALEKMLAFDNLVVFAAIFSYWRIDDKYQHKILHWGILGAIFFRLLFVAIGAGALEMIGPKMDILFAIVIAYTAYLMIREDDDEEKDYVSAWYIRPFKQWCTFADFGDKFFVKTFGSWHVTKLFLALVTIEISDVMFSFDSVPAVIAVTKEPFLIYSSMIFAILGLRSLYFVLSALLRYLVYLEKAVIVVLFFISAKLLIGSIFGWHLTPLIALLITVSILGVGVFSSLLIRETKQ